ncbi:ABC transporter permease [Streptomyces sp. CA-210063]|uniref:ABC transporter permease n=1 Tax=Streptomyces sp. CA-210063 TaxID=2801029 RepID=UPI00214B0118|nr:ABC transporter permease [Streptomyces sp. CA-210063]UUU32880.1 ABC transporter permease [Streptomyces sp. CA-210063]
MTATSTPAVAAAPGPRRGLRLRGTAWTVWRAHRSALLVWCAYVLAMAGWLLWLRIVTLHEIDQEAASCGDSDPCIDVLAAMTYSSDLSMIGTLVSYLCYGVAAWAGAALTGRELERGTAQLAWTQSVTPTRWLAAKLAVPAVVLVLGTTALVLLYRWAWAADRGMVGDEWFYPDPMVNRGPLLVAYALCALAVGALAGLALRRALPALAVALGFMAWFHVFLDQHTRQLWPTTTLTDTAASRVPENADQIALGSITDSGARVSDLSCFNDDGASADAVRACMANHEFTGLYAEVHPPSHFWPLHLMATGVVLAVTVLATAAAFRLLRRRTR